MDRAETGKRQKRSTLILEPPKPKAEGVGSRACVRTRERPERMEGRWSASKTIKTRGVGQPCKMPFNNRAMGAGIKHRRRTIAAAEPSLTLNVGETSVTFPFKCEDARTFQEEMQKLLLVFKDKAEKGQRKKLEAMEYKYSEASDGEDKMQLEVYCNPNAYPDAFQAKALITVRSNSLKITTEGRLSAIKSDLDSFMDNCN